MNSASKDLIQIVREAIHHIDPHGLLAAGAPKDELDSQILAIAGRVSRARSSHEAAQAIAEVLNAAFSDKLTASAYSKEASVLFTRLHEKGLV